MAGDLTAVNSVVWRGIIPILVFGILSASAFKYLVMELMETNELATLRSDFCPIPFQGVSPYQLHYLGGYLSGIEQTLCVLVAFFHPLLQPEAVEYGPFLREFGMSLIACAVVPLMESSRDRKPFFPGVPAIFGLLCQVFTGGALFPIFWILLIVFVGEQGAGSRISQAKAESVLAAIVLGYYLPSFVIYFYPSILPIAIWQISPLCMSVVSTVYVQLRSKDAHQASGYRITQLAYIIIAVTAACTHMGTLTSYNFDLQRYLDGCIPVWTALDAAEGHTMIWTSNHLLQWDAMFLFGSSFLACLWFTRSLAEAGGIIAWITIATLAIGPGATFATVLIWREVKLNGEKGQSAAFSVRTQKN